MRIYATEKYYNELIKNCDDDNLKHGIEGEKEVFYHLKQLGDDKTKGFIIPNFKFSLESDNIECDFLVVTKSCLVILEVKNWSLPGIKIDEIGQVITPDGSNRGNIKSQTNRQSIMLQNKLKNDFNYEIPVIKCLLFADLKNINISNCGIDIIDYSSVFPQIDKYTRENSELINLRKIHTDLIKINKNQHFNIENYYKDIKSEYFLDIFEPNDYAIYKYRVRKHFNDTRDLGYSIIMPKNMPKYKSIIDERCFAVIYNLFIIGFNYYFEIEDKNIEAEVKCFIILSLLLIKNKKCKVNNTTIFVPISCNNEDIEIYSKQVIEYWQEQLYIISDITKYEIIYNADKDYHIVYNNFNDNSDNTIYVQEITQFNYQSNKIDYDDDIWLADRINYKISIHGKIILEIIEKIFKFQSFKEGQLECIRSVFENYSNQIIMLPTGQGKSLVFYLLLLLQPKKGIIVYPTDLLIKDQITKLNEFGIYNINNFCESKKINNQLIQMMKPDDILEKNVLESFINQDSQSISYVILDEVHCLSKYSHDFRPEYFLMHNKINYYLDNTIVKGFTATATWEVLEDLQKQFNIAANDIFSPDLSKDNVNYVIKKINKGQKIEQLQADLIYIHNKYPDKKILVFKNSTNNEVELKCNLNLDGVVYKLNDIDMFRLNSGYYTLVASSDAGIGIDIPEVNSIIHYDQPLSIADFAQHTGRGGRTNGYCTSIVYYDDSACSYVLSDNNNINELITNIYVQLKANWDSGYNWAKIPVDSNKINDLKFILFSYFELGIISEWWRIDSNNFGLGINNNYNLDFSLIRRHILKDNIYDQSFIKKISYSNTIVDLVSNYYEWFVDWNNYFKTNSYNNMRELLHKIETYHLDDSEIQKIIKSETYYSNQELFSVERITKMSLDEICDFAIANAQSLNDYKKYFNTTNYKLMFLEILIDLINNESENIVLQKIDILLSLLSENDKYEFVISLMKSNFTEQNNYLMDYIYVNIYKISNTDKQKIIFNILENSKINEKYKFLFLFELINNKIEENYV